MTKAQLKAIVAQLDALLVPDSAEIKVEMAIDNSRIGILPYPFEVEKLDASYAPDAQGNWAEAVSQADAVILKQG